MKLVKCYVASFGKLQNFTYDFNSELNTIKEENGWGKSTLATFIKSMFYGLNDSKRNVAENERVKYRPWGSNEKFGGYVQFVWGNKEYKIERFFGSKESEDTVMLFDVATCKPYSNTENLGKRIFEIDEDGFLSTTYFSQKDFQVKSNTSLTAKFNAVCEVQDTDAFDRAVAKLEEKAKTFKYRGEKGIINDCKREIYYLNDEIERSNRAVQTVALLKKDAEVLQQEVNELQKQSKILTEKVGLAGKAEAAAIKRSRYEKLLLEKKVLDEDFSDASSVIGNNSVSENDVNTYQQKLNEIGVLTSRAESIKTDIVSLEKYTIEKVKTKKTSAIDIALLIAATTLLLGGIILCALNVSVIVGVIVAVLGVALYLPTIIKLVKPKKDNSVNPYQELLETKRIELDKTLAQKIELENFVDVFINRFNLGEKYDRVTSLEYIKKIIRASAEIKQKLNAVNLELVELEKSKGEFLTVTENTQSLTALNSELNRVQNEYSRKTVELANKRSSINTHEEFASKVPEFEGKKAELNEKIARCEEEYDLLNKTVKFLKQADENLKIKYRAPLQNSLKKYYELVTNSDKEVNIDIDLKVTIGENSGQKVTDYYSKGYQNLFEICKRFALTDVLFTGEKPFIILDDPFYNLDDKKLSAALELLKSLSNEYQIIYLVCHESRVAK